MVKHLIACFFLVGATPNSPANILLTNPGAESGDLSGWTPVWKNLPASVPEATASVVSNPSLSSEGSHSFLLSDHSTQRSVGIMYASRIPFSAAADHVLSFDALILSGFVDPWVSIELYSVPTGGAMVSQINLSFATPSDFESITSVANGFSHYEVLLAQSVEGSGPPPSSVTLYMGVTFFSDFDDAKQGEVLIDNVSLDAVPEPGSTVLLCAAMVALASRRRRPAAA